MRADKELDPQLLFQLINPVTDGAWGERQLVGGRANDSCRAATSNVDSLGELPAVQQPGT